MAWYYVANGSSVGPVEAGEVQNLRQQNVITSDTPVWTDGMAEWMPFDHSPLAAGSAPGVATLAPAAHTCVECGKLFPESEMLQYENSWVCPTCKPVFFQRLREGVAVPGTLNYAGIGSRFLAVLVDGLILLFVLFLPIMIVTMITAVSRHGGGGAPGWLTALFLIVEYGGPAAYEIFFIGRYGATPGKMLMKIRVVSPSGGPISYGRATGRYFAKILSGIILYIGYLMAFWDDEKRALHDRICETRVIKVSEV